MVDHLPSLRSTGIFYLPVLLEREQLYHREQGLDPRVHRLIHLGPLQQRTPDTQIPGLSDRPLTSKVQSLIFYGDVATVHLVTFRRQRKAVLGIQSQVIYEPGHTTRRLDRSRHHFLRLLQVDLISKHSINFRIRIDVYD